MKRRKFLVQSSLSAGMFSGVRNFLQADEKELFAMPDYQSTGAKLLTGSTPAADGFRYPAEWVEHDYTIMVMPPPQNWKDYGIPLGDVRG